MSPVSARLTQLFSTPTLPNPVSLGLLALRLVAGPAMMFHGWGKIQNPFDWMGPEAATPALFQALAAISEFGGGLCWLLGLFTPLLSAGMVCTMIVAVYTHAIQRGDPFVGMGGPSYELASLFLSIGLLLMLAGPGKFSLDRQFFGSR